MAHDRFPPPQYDPRVADPTAGLAHGALSTRVLILACVAVVLLIIGLLWWTGIPTK